MDAGVLEAAGSRLIGHEVSEDSSEDNKYVSSAEAVQEFVC